MKTIFNILKSWFRPKYFYIVHGGIVISKNDMDAHFITANRVSELYGLRKSDYCKTWCFEYDRLWINIGKKSIYHLHPNNDGDYSLPTVV